MHIFTMTVLGALLGYVMSTAGVTAGKVEYWLILAIAVLFYAMGAYGAIYK